MENLIKPVDYAAKMGISRQAVYAKIKKGLLPSKNVGGKIYVVMEEKAAAENVPVGSAGTEAGGENVGRLLAAKEETIAVLKETIRDLKETNQMITSTLRSEVELLKEAFGEMKTLYAAQIEHIQNAEESPIPLAEIAEDEETEQEKSVPSKTLKEEKRKKTEADDGYITLDAFLEEQGIRKKRLRKRISELAKEQLEKGKKGIKPKKNGIALSPDKAARLLEKALKKKV
ncbi:DUF3972 domain-containing protein [Nitratifractor sp.]|uniref:DUF3972 domain-containing protein n=1 Tax=Nitratifractor sp. TaxID=2268144 RepID=UPI0025E6B3EC|nr:DUF3972 domain-containing protein [Nitratifractor sp.]